jgi:SAM-dependent methyltransferase
MHSGWLLREQKYFTLELKERLPHVFNNKRVLDVGSRDGLNAVLLATHFDAREVIGIDIDSTYFTKYPIDTFTDKVSLIQSDILEYNPSEKFDIITCFLWNMIYNTYDNIMIKMKSLLNTDGKIYIGIHDSVYKKINDPCYIPKLVERYFNHVTIIKAELQWIICATV